MSIGKEAFVGCEKLASVFAGIAVNSTSRCAFGGAAITAITLPASATKLGEGIACGCGLKPISLAEGTENVRLESLIEGPRRVSGLWIPRRRKKDRPGLVRIQFHGTGCGRVPCGSGEQFCREKGIKYAAD